MRGLAPAHMQPPRPQRPFGSAAAMRAPGHNRAPTSSPHRSTGLCPLLWPFPAAHSSSRPALPQISPECRDLLCKLLVGDPRHRLSMAQIQAHPWFLTNLPPDALAMNE